LTEERESEVRRQKKISVKAVAALSILPPVFYLLPFIILPVEANSE